MQIKCRGRGGYLIFSRRQDYYAEVIPDVSVAQLDRASASEAEGRRFDSYRAHTFASALIIAESP